MRWICKRTERPPTEQDADAQGCVIAWHMYQGCMIYKWWLVEKNQYITHWMCCPDGPGNAAKAAAI